jgi:glucose-1-phosphate thymidylyltransferase
MPIYDKPMIYYPLSTLMLAEIKDILIISTPRDLPAFQSLLGDGSQWGLNLSYAEQAEPKGLPEAFTLGKDFIGSDSVCLILGDNIFHGHGLSKLLVEAAAQVESQGGCSLFSYQVQDPERYGIVEFDSQHRVLSIEEKPEKPKSNYAITGIYLCDKNVVQIAQGLKPSARGELEITDVIRGYLKQGKCSVNLLSRGFAWLDTGTHKALLEASQYVYLLEERQGLKVACVEEIAWRKGFINSEQLKKLAQPYLKSGYGKYLLNLLKEER